MSKPAPPVMFVPPTAKLTIGSVSDSELTVVAQYNPKELAITQPVQWHEHRATGAEQTDALDIEFGGMQPQSMKIELFFDGAERNGKADKQTVMEKILALKQLASVQDPSSPDATKRSPHFCVVTWGGDLPPLRCVIESLQTTYQMFSSTGVILRATVSIQLKEANRIAKYPRAA